LLSRRLRFHFAAFRYAEIVATFHTPLFADIRFAVLRHVTRYYAAAVLPFFSLIHTLMPSLLPLLLLMPLSHFAFLRRFATPLLLPLPLMLDAADAAAFAADIFRYGARY